MCSEWRNQNLISEAGATVRSIGWEDIGPETLGLGLECPCGR